MALRSRQVAFVLALASLAAALALPSRAGAAPRLVAADRLELAVVARVNAVRKARGLPVLAGRAALKRAATRHVTNMAYHGYFSHAWSTGTPFERWIRRFWPGTGTWTSWSVGENLYWRGPTITARQVVNAWLRSRPHRRNLLARGWRSVGVGAVETLDPLGAYSGPTQATIVAAEFGVRRR
ncbi:MAG: CAP domain-containing protein [Thermoleophilia bacterium]|nr:CAP domain-containing protein [Thermoleophilia bacterium]